MSDQPPVQRQDAEVTYTFDWYRDLLGRLGERGYDFRTYEGDPGPGEVLVRHDVDLSPTRALEIARIEAANDVTASYFFLVSSPLYNPLHEPTRETIREIASLGHEVGLHFSTHQYWEPDDPPERDELVDRVGGELEILGLVVESPSTVSFHIPPGWILSKRFEPFTNTYEPRFLEEIDYVADSNQRWRERPPFADGIPGSFQILTHPGLWGQRDAPFRQRVQNATTGSQSRANEYVTSRYIEQEYG